MIVFDDAGQAVSAKVLGCEVMLSEKDAFVGFDFASFGDVWPVARIIVLVLTTC